MENKKETFEGGAKRNQRYPRVELVDPTFLWEMAEIMQAGAIIYGENNWQKGGQDFVQDIPRHMLQHVLAIMGNVGNDDTKENHLAHLACNVMMFAKLRKKYPYIIPGSPTQLPLPATDCFVDTIATPKETK